MHRGRPYWLQAFRKSKHPLTWLSLVVMGSGCFRFRQFGKGIALSALKDRDDPRIDPNPGILHKP